MNEQVVTASTAGSGIQTVQPLLTQSVPMSLVDLGKRLLDASKRGDTYEIRTLMSSGAPFTTDWLGTSPLHFAAMYGHLDTVTILLRAGISRDARTKVDRTPLHVASQAGHFDIVQILLKNNAIIDAIDMLRMTPLHWAVENGHTNVVNLLLKNDADASLIDKFGRTPMDIALGNMQMDIVQLLQTANVQNLRTVVNQETIVEEEVLTSSDQTAGVMVSAATADDSEGALDGAAPTAIVSGKPETSSMSKTASSGTGGSNKDGGGGNTSVLATLAALAEATASTTNTPATDTATWLSSRGLSLAEPSASTQFTLTEAGKLALTNYMKEQGVASDPGTVMTLVDEEGNQVVLVQQGNPAESTATTSGGENNVSSANSAIISNGEGEETNNTTTDLHIDTTAITEESIG